MMIEICAVNVQFEGETIVTFVLKIPLHVKVDGVAHAVGALGVPIEALIELLPRAVGHHPYEDGG
jgi:hypothetical protein